MALDSFALFTDELEVGVDGGIGETGWLFLQNVISFCCYYF